jgi:hypothetical protein
MEGMPRTNLFFKVELKHDADEDPSRVANEIRRQILRFYGVRDVEISNLVTDEAEPVED